MEPQNLSVSELRDKVSTLLRSVSVCDAILLTMEFALHEAFKHQHGA